MSFADLSAGRPVSGRVCRRKKQRRAASGRKEVDAAAQLATSKVTSLRRRVRGRVLRAHGLAPSVLPGWSGQGCEGDRGDHARFRHRCPAQRPSRTPPVYPCDAGIIAPVHPESFVPARR